MSRGLGDVYKRQDKSVTWYNSNINVVSVASNGTLTAVGPGTATVRAVTKNGNQAECTVKVIQPVTGIGLNWAGYNLNIGTTVQLKVNVSPSNASYPAVTWRSSNPAAATVDANGLVTAKGAGTAKITASTDNGLTATCIIKVYAPVPPPSSSQPSTSAPDSGTDAGAGNSDTAATAAAQ
mgnify:FL=1